MKEDTGSRHATAKTLHNEGRGEEEGNDHLLLLPPAVSPEPSFHHQVIPSTETASNVLLPPSSTEEFSFSFSSLDDHFDFGVHSSSNKDETSSSADKERRNAEGSHSRSSGVHTPKLTSHEDLDVKSEGTLQENPVSLSSINNVTLVSTSRQPLNSSTSSSLCLPSFSPPSLASSSASCSPPAISHPASSRSDKASKRENFLIKERKKELDRRSRLLTHQLEQAELLAWLSWFRFIHSETLLASPLLLASILSLYLSYCSRRASELFPSSSRLERNSLSQPKERGRKEGDEGGTRRKQEGEREREGEQGTSSSSSYPKIPAHGAAVFAFLRETFEVVDLPNFHPFFLPLQSTHLRRSPAPSSFFLSSSSSSSSAAPVPLWSSSVYDIPFPPKVSIPGCMNTPPFSSMRPETRSLVGKAGGAGRRKRRRKVLPYGGGALRFRLLRAVERKKGTSAMVAVLSVALCRVLGIRARLVLSLPPSEVRRPSKPGESNKTSQRHPLARYLSSIFDLSI